MIWLGCYVLSIFAANWLIATFGLVPVAPGLLAPAGVYAAGLSFTFRDLAQERLGRRWTLGAVIAGAGLSALLSPQLALASGCAFLFSELADLLVYSRLRGRHWLGAVAASNVVGFVLDSVLFLAIAFGSLEFLLGQLVGKGLMTVLAVAALSWWRGRRVVVAR